MIAFLRSPLGKIAAVALLLIGLYLGFRVWLHQHDQATLSGYVLLSEKTTAEAKADEMERQRNAARQAVDDYDKRLTVAQVSEQKAKDTLESEISNYERTLSEKNRACLADIADRDWVLHH